MSRRHLRMPLVLATGLLLLLTGCEAAERSSETTAACTEVLEALDSAEDAEIQSRNLESFLAHADSAENPRLTSLASDARAALDEGDPERVRSILERAREECEQQGV